MIREAFLAGGKTVAGNSDPIDAGLGVARALWEAGESAGAESRLRALVAQAPEREDAAMLLAEVLRSQGRLGAAAAALAALCEARGFEAELSLRCAKFVQQCDRHATAARICESALARGPVPPELRFVAGNVAREAGNFELARARYLEALAAGIDLDRHHVLAALANTRRYEDPADPDIARFAAGFADPQRAPRARASAGFALAKVQDDLADHRHAAATLRAANALVRSVRRWDAEGWNAFVRSRQQGQFTIAGGHVDTGFLPVFIVGVPRSGTTLTATLLAQATGGRDRGELRTLRYIDGQLVAGRHHGSPAALAEAANLYRILAAQDDAPANCYIDQDPLNFRYVDLIAAMFPQARIIHVRRDPRDVALSLWSQDFAHPDLGFANDFADIAKFSAGHDALMRHWRRILRLPIHELAYEALVADPAATLAAARDFIGAGAPAAGTGESSAPVQSASVWQARQPVYSTSMGRWRNYAPYLPELLQFGPMG